MLLQYGSYTSECYNIVTAYSDVGFAGGSVDYKPTIPGLANKLRTGPLLVISSSGTSTRGAFI